MVLLVLRNEQTFGSRTRNLKMVSQVPDLIQSRTALSLTLRAATSTLAVVVSHLRTKIPVLDSTTTDVP